MIDHSKPLLVFSAMILSMGLAGCGDAGDTPGPGPGGNDGGGTVADGGPEPDPDGGMSATGPVATLAGSGESGVDDGPGRDARFSNPANVAVDAMGNVYVADFDNSAIRRITTDGTVSTLTSQPGFGYPFGMAVVGGNTLFVQTDADEMGSRANSAGMVWRIDMGSGRGTAVAREIGRPRGLAALPDGRLVLADPAAHTIRVMDASSGMATLLAGAEGMSGYADGAGAAARFNRPTSVAVLPSGDIVVADQDNHRLRLVNLGGAVSTYAGTGTAGAMDGPRAGAQFNRPQAVAADRAGNLYVADAENYTIRRVDTGGNVTTIAGSTRGFSDGERRRARFYGMEGLAVSADGMTLYVADGHRGSGGPYNRVRRVALTK